jgi:pyrroloquinoline quinone biosynthesis protein E
MIGGERPYTLVAEVTHRCPLRCPYCANPLELTRRADELDTASWCRVLAEAEALGVVQVNLTGGEPLVRDDLERLVVEARRLDLYTNLITSGVPLAAGRLEHLGALGLDAVQLSLQDVEPAAADRIAGIPAHERKLEAARRVRALGLSLTVNVVLHRENLDRVPAIIALAERLGADRLELANTQYLGWALANRGALLPARARVERAREIAAAARERLRGVMEVVFVLPDYLAGAPRPCMDGWGRRYIVVTPDGVATPCHLARTLPGLGLESVRDRPLAEIWERSAGFVAFRGEAWMREPCRSCPQRTVDYGGCRCQAFHLTGDATATDPACALAPAHALVERACREAEEAAPVRLRWREPPAA